MLRLLLASTFCLVSFSKPTLADDNAVALEAAKSSKQCWPLDKSVPDDELHRLFNRCYDAFEKYHHLSTHASGASLRNRICPVGAYLVDVGFICDREG